jgi:hypothetical protein
MESSRSLALTLADIDIWHHVLLTGLSLVTVLFLVLFIQEMRRGRAPMIESNWGGIGGGGGGWRMSSSFAYLLGMLGTATLLVVIVRVESSKPTIPGAATPPPPANATASPTPRSASTPSPPAATPSSTKAAPSP